MTANQPTASIESTLEQQRMKQNFGRKSHSLAHSLAAILFGVAGLAPNAGANDEAIVHTAGGVPYVSGGVGAMSIDRLSSLARDFNLKLVFALQSGEYVSDVRVAIADAAGRTLLNTTSEGPWFLTSLPIGTYQIVATFAGNAVVRQIAVNSAKHRTIDFRWSGE